jgi:hypothetical protein
MTPSALTTSRQVVSEAVFYPQNPSLCQANASAPPINNLALDGFQGDDYAEE